MLPMMSLLLVVICIEHIIHVVSLFRFWAGWSPVPSKYIYAPPIPSALPSLCMVLYHRGLNAPTAVDQSCGCCHTTYAFSEVKTQFSNNHGCLGTGWVA